MYTNTKTRCDKISPPVDIDFDNNTSAISEASIMHYIRNRGHVSKYVIYFWF